MACWSVNPARSALAICCSASASWPLNRATRRRRSQRTSAAGAKNPAVAAAAPQKAPASQVPAAANDKSAQRLSRRIWRGSMKRNMALKSRTDRARYFCSYCRKAFRSTSNARNERKNAEAPASRKTAAAAMSGPPRRDRTFAVPTDDLDGPVPLLLQLAGAVRGEERPLVDDAALLLRIEVVGIAQQQRERPQILRQREHLRLLGQREERHRGEALLLLRRDGGARRQPPRREHDHVLQQRHGAQLLRLRIAEAADHVDMVVGPHPEPHGMLLLDVDSDGAPSGLDEGGELDLSRALEVADQDGVARLKRRQQTLPHRALGALAVRLDEGAGDEARRHLPDGDHPGRKLRPFLDVLLRAEHLDRAPALP